jgi:hypothetical protein
MAWSVDRLGRSLQDLIGFLSELHALRIDLFLHQQGLDTTTPAVRRIDLATTAPAAWLDSAFGPRLFEPKSPLPGNGILRAETKRPKRL